MDQSILLTSSTYKKASHVFWSGGMKTGETMNLSTIAIEKELSQFLSTAYTTLFKEYFLFTLAMIISCVIFPVFIVRILGKYERNRVPKAYLFKVTTKLGLHYTILCSLLVIAAVNVYQSIQLAQNTDIFDGWIILWSILLMLFTVPAVYFLSKFRSKGLIMTGMLVMLDSAYCQYLRMLRVKAIIESSKNFKTVVRYGYYMIADSLVVESMILSLLAVIILALIVFYYYKRRFLFMPGKLNMLSCPQCGKAISRGEDFCICCGQMLRVNPIQQTIKPLDKERYCKKCGRAIFGWKCVICNSPEAIEEIAKNRAKEKRASIVRGILSMVVIFGMLVPIFAEPVAKIQRGTAMVHNIFVSRWNELYETPEKGTDPEWVFGFDSDIEALYLADMRWYYVKPRMIPYDKLAFYAQYAEASFMQMEELEEIKEFVHSISLESIESDRDTYCARHTELSDRLNWTVDAQAMALQNFSLPQNLFEKVEHIFFSGVRYYISGIDIGLVAVLIIITNICLLMYLLNSFSLTMETGLERWNRINSTRIGKFIERFQAPYHVSIPDTILHRVITAITGCGYCMIRSICELWMMAVQLCCTLCLVLSLFRPKNWIGCLRWVKRGLTDVRGVPEKNSAQKKFERQERISSAIAVAIAIVLFGGGSLAAQMAALSKGEAVDAKNTYLDQAQMAVMGYAVDISDALLRIKTTKTLTEEEKESLYILFDAQLEVDQLILDYDITGLEDYAELHAGLCSLCVDDMRMIQKIKDSIENGLVPSEELLQNYASLRGENYLWVLEKLGQEDVEAALESAFDL